MKISATALRFTFASWNSQTPNPKATTQLHLRTSERIEI